jgi:hypothetical protein
VKRKSADDEEPFFSKRIDLNRDFYIQMAEFPKADRNGLKGFGLTIDHQKLETFCWEWFVVDREKRATKLQEDGELAFDAKKVGTNWEVTRTEFLTDVTFRVQLSEMNRPGYDLKWRVTILKGSHVSWPSLVGDTVIINN